jgi:hypothetical protein
MSRLFLLLAITLPALCPLRAQLPGSTPVPLAPGPLLNRAPDYSQWLVSVKSGTTSAVEVPTARTSYDQRTLIRKTGTIRDVITVTGTGQRTDKWCEGGLQASVTPGGGTPGVSMYTPTALFNTGYTDYSKSDFPGFEWISRNNYIGRQTMQGVDCIVFRDPPAPDASSTPAASPAAASQVIPPIGRTAYIAAEGRLPVLLQVDNVTTSYQWMQPPTAPLTPPPAVQAALDQARARLDVAAKPPAAP